LKKITPLLKKIIFQLYGLLILFAGVFRKKGIPYFEIPALFTYKIVILFLAFRSWMKGELLTLYTTNRDKEKGWKNNVKNLCFLI